MFFGLIVAWVLVRYTFFGKQLVDAMVDLPFAMPTAVSGIALTTLYSTNGWIGRWLAPFGIEVAYTSLGVMVALMFIGLPFVVRTLAARAWKTWTRGRGSGGQPRRQPDGRPSFTSSFRRSCRRC